MPTHEVKKTLDFEKPIVELQHQIQSLKHYNSDKKIDFTPEIKKLEEKLINLKKDIYINLTPWQRVQTARHPQRPYTLDYINLIMTDFMEIHGDRYFSDDKALVGGFAKIDGRKVMVLGHQKGRDYKENIKRNFGCANPEGYRKALRLMQIAHKFELPVVIFIDTPGAYPGLGAEERGQAQAIAYNLREMFAIATPIVAVIIGEGGSGGALGIGVADKVCVLENAYYSVISPEGCAAILWKNSANAPMAADVLKLTGQDLLRLGIIDEVIPEPMGGAHYDHLKMAATLKEVVLKNLKELININDKEKLLELRYSKFRNIGKFL